MVELILIHGFTQDASTWDEVRKHIPTDWIVHAVDLPGHGDHRDVIAGSAEDFLAAISESLPRSKDPARRILCGYSMGGRVALRLASAEPTRWSNVVIISSGAGISDPYERLARQEADEQLAMRFLDEGWLEEFASYWDSLPIWNGDPPKVQQARLEMLLRQSPEGLASALRAFGQGIAPPFGGFGPLDAPDLTVVRGTRDATYIEPCQYLAGLASTKPVVVDGGHSLVLENPAAIATVINDL